MYEDKIEVASPGGLPVGISKKEYLHGQISQLRNPVLGNILSSSEILEKVEFKKDKLNRILKNLIQKNYIDVIGNGRGTKYLKK